MSHRMLLLYASECWSIRDPDDDDDGVEGVTINGDVPLFVFQKRRERERVGGNRQRTTPLSDRTV